MGCPFGYKGDNPHLGDEADVDSDLDSPQDKRRLVGLETGGRQRPARLRALMRDTSTLGGPAVVLWADAGPPPCTCVFA
jgi:hypothetical protein